MQGMSPHKTSFFQALVAGEVYSGESYANWKRAKLAQCEVLRDSRPVEIDDLSHPTADVVRELTSRCDQANLAIYRANGDLGESETRQALRTFASALSLNIAERHRSAGDQGVVALKFSEAAGQKGYIPYSRRPMNWHTDGYYNGPEDRIRAFVLHCVESAEDGGENQLLDPEIALIRLYDRDPRLVAALARFDAMSIPENKEPDGSIRPVSVGPVFFIDESSGRPAMRYTARTRSIEWADRSDVAEAREALNEILASDDPMIVSARLSPGWGIINNNVLHNRTGFQDGQGGNRLVFRVRFNNRVGERATNGKTE